MTSKEFEEAAKKAVVQEIREMHNEYFSTNDIQVVWMAHILGNKKCILIDTGYSKRLYEVTYNVHKMEIYVDEYDKTNNRVFSDADLNRFMREENQKTP